MVGWMVGLLAGLLVGQSVDWSCMSGGDECGFELVVAQ